MSKPIDQSGVGTLIFFGAAIFVAILWFMQPSKPSHADQLLMDAVSCADRGRAHTGDDLVECLSDAEALRSPTFY